MTLRIAIALVLMLFSAVVPGCATQIESVNRLEESVAFIEDGITSRQDIVKTLGAPSASYDDGLLNVYFFISSKNGVEVAENRPTDSRSPQLVLEFDETDVVLRHKVVLPP